MKNPKWECRWSVPNVEINQIEWYLEINQQKRPTRPGLDPREAGRCITGPLSRPRHLPVVSPRGLVPPRSLCACRLPQPPPLADP